MMEIGGYIELDTYHLPMLHENAIALNCGRNALAYVLRARKIKRLWLPQFICGSVIDVCKREQIPYLFYNIGWDFLPQKEILLDENEWIYFINYYSQFDNDRISKFVSQYKNIIVDNAQSYFQLPIPGIDTLYTCRKYFGVADGAFLYTNVFLGKSIPIDESFQRMHFLLGRYERCASEFYRDFVTNEELFKNEPIKRMSKLTCNLLHGIDYNQVESIRENNFCCLHKILKRHNKLNLKNSLGTFMYPLFLENGAEIRIKLQTKKIFIPMLWPNVLRNVAEDTIEFKLASNILPLPIDQRYGKKHMIYIANKVLEEIK